MVFDESAPRKGKRGGIEHFGFRLTKPKDVDLAAKAVEQAGGRIRGRDLVRDSDEDRSEEMTLSILKKIDNRMQVPVEIAARLENQ